MTEAKRRSAHLLAFQTPIRHEEERSLSELSFLSATMEMRHTVQDSLLPVKIQRMNCFLYNKQGGRFVLVFHEAIFTQRF